MLMIVIFLSLALLFPLVFFLWLRHRRYHADVRGLYVELLRDGERVGPQLKALSRVAREFRFMILDLDGSDARLTYPRAGDNPYRARRSRRDAVQVRTPEGDEYEAILEGDGVSLPDGYTLAFRDRRRRDRRRTDDIRPTASGSRGRVERSDDHWLDELWGPRRPPSEPEHFLSGQMPAQTSQYSEVSLIVRISAVAPVGSEVVTPLRDLKVSSGRTPVTVVVESPQGLVPEEDSTQVIWLLPGRDDPDPLRFAFQAREVGLHRIRVTAWSGGTFLGELVLEVSVKSGGHLIEADPRVAHLGLIQSNPGEVTLQINADGDRYVFQLISESYLGRLTHAEALIAEPSIAVERAISTLRNMALGRSDYTASNARRWMKEVGVGLWNDMVPQVIKEEFWQLRSEITAFSIAATDELIPWELLYPLVPDQDEGFLVEQFPVLRRAPGQGRSKRMKVADPRFVVSSRSPANARNEIEAIQQIVGHGEILHQLDVLLDLIDSGDPGLMHFACHNTFQADRGGSEIAMAGGPFVPGLLNSAVAQRSLATSSPLVFINACRTAGTVPEYTQMMGWAQRFMAAGAGAFAGTLWAVRSESAARFAEVFYTALKEDKSLGEAAFLARVEAREADPDPSWLAYSIYGSPTATITPGRAITPSRRREDPWR